MANEDIKDIERYKLHIPSMIAFLFLRLTVQYQTKYSIRTTQREKAET